MKEEIKEKEVVKQKTKKQPHIQTKYCTENDMIHWKPSQRRGTQAGK